MSVEYTKEQLECIESLIGPVDVSAGAGSGKTFTLTQRIACALEDPTSGVDDVDQICAITFTEKAAAELKGRVRSTLRAKGMFDQALKVDGAWISTIHGMCARILRTQALQLGIDPYFAVMGEGDRDRLLRSCIDSVLGADSRGPREYQDLYRFWQVETQGYGDSISSLLKQIMDASSGLEGGPSQLQRCQQPQVDASQLARTLLSVYQDILPYLAAYKPGKYRDEALAAVEAGIETLENYLQQGEKDIEPFCKVLARCKVARTLTAKDIKPICEDYKARHQAVVRLAVMARSEALLDRLIQLAQKVQALFMEEKLQRGVLDNNDLVFQAARALRNPDIASLYSRKFRLVMVDEFQDTDQLQLSIVKQLAGPGMRYLCTVGDAQQSIYGFRGADIQVYRAYQAALDNPQLARQGSQPKKLKLSKNFRSHADVLAFVKKVCHQPAVFGDGFLDLEATYDGKEYKAQEPRIQLCVSAAAKFRQPGDSIAAARRVQAVQIADYFARMHAQGHALSDMVLLLGSTSQAGLYAQAIRDAVGPCIIAGGSLFTKAPEVAVVENLLHAIVNPRDNQRLFAALSSEMFALDAGDFLALNQAYNPETGIVQRCSIDRGLAALMARVQRGDTSGLSPQLVHAVQVMGKTQQALPMTPVYQVLQTALQDSGWLLRLERQQAEGLSKVGNILKAVRLVQSLEKDNGIGPATVAKLFSNELACLREAPGALNVGGQEAVRIMTIHASKGLEFPIVAMADFDKKYMDRSLVVRKVDGMPYVSLAVKKILGSKTEFKFEYNIDDLSFGPIQTAAPDMFHIQLREAAVAAEREECQRLFYVGATRAKEALCVFLALKPSKDGLVYQDDLASDIQNALFAGPYPAQQGVYEYGGSCPLAYRIATATGEDPLARVVVDEAAGVSPVAVLQVQPFEWMNAQLPDRQSTGLYSYSSYSKMLKDEKKTEPVEPLQMLDLDAEQLAGDLSAKASTADADKATDFGSALHRLCQIAALQGFDVARSRVDALCATYGVRDRDRLSRALENWLASRECAQAYSFDCVRPELPFNIHMGELVMEGEIDLICTNAGDMSKAFIVDYKTGGRPDETYAQLQEKHGLQAKCYAYAVLCQGYESVELVFYRVEQGNSVSFAFTQADLPWLCEQACPSSSK